MGKNTFFDGSPIDFHHFPQHKNPQQGPGEGSPSPPKLSPRASRQSLSSDVTTKTLRTAGSFEIIKHQMFSYIVVYNQILTIINSIVDHL